jgi:hypothetical protein
MMGHATILITLDTYSHVLPNMQEGEKDVPSHPLEPLNTGDQEPSDYFPDSLREAV